MYLFLRQVYFGARIMGYYWKAASVSQLLAWQVWRRNSMGSSRSRKHYMTPKQHHGYGTVKGSSPILVTERWASSLSRCAARRWLYKPSPAAITFRQAFGHLPSRRMSLSFDQVILFGNRGTYSWEKLTQGCYAALSHKEMNPRHIDRLSTTPLYHLSNEIRENNSETRLLYSDKRVRFIPSTKLPAS